MGSSCHLNYGIMWYFPSWIGVPRNYWNNPGEVRKYNPPLLWDLSKLINPVCPNLIKWLGLFEVTWLIVGVACKHLIHIVGINFIGIIDYRYQNQTPFVVGFVTYDNLDGRGPWMSNLVVQIFFKPLARSKLKPLLACSRNPCFSYLVIWKLFTTLKDRYWKKKSCFSYTRWIFKDWILLSCTRFVYVPSPFDSMASRVDGVEFQM
jgi:hypothetical protein